jgi:TPR repeat protein
MSGMDRNGWKALLGRARRGDVEAQCDAAMYYYNGHVEADGEVVVRRNPHRALRWYQEAAEHGCVRGQDQMGVLLSEGRGIPKDFYRALHWARKAAAQQDAMAAHNLATIYRDMGRHRSAFRWVKRAVSLGDPSSLMEMGLALFFGIGVSPNPTQACQCFRRVLDHTVPLGVDTQDHEDARLWLGIAHLMGAGAGRSSVKARELLELADSYRDNTAAQAILRVLGRTDLYGGRVPDPEKNK